MSERSDIVSRIVRFNKGRDQERLALKYKAMAENALGFLRGTCHLFCEDWPRAGRLNAMPLAWVCGDLHIENFGAYKGDNRLTYFDIADFDEAMLAPCSLDLTRVATSAILAAKIHGLKRKAAIALCGVFLEGYTAALRDGKARWIERATAKGPIRSLLKELEARKRAAFIAAHTEPRSDAAVLAIDQKHTLAIDHKGRKRIERFMRGFADRRANPRFFKVLDVARRIAGTGALGLPRYMLLIEGRGTPSGRFLLDLKYAAPSALARCVTAKQPRWKSDAERVVAIGRRTQAIAPALLEAVLVDGKPFVLRELMPMQDNLDIKSWRGQTSGLDLLARDLGFLVAWSELRSGGRDGSATIDELIAFANQPKWQHSVLEYAEAYANVAWHDWETFRDAYQRGALK